MKLSPASLVSLGSRACLVALVAIAMPLAAIGCSGGSSAGTTSGLPGPGDPQPGQPNPPVVDNGGDAHFNASSVEASRYSTTCGVQDPPFAPSDQLTLRAIGTKGGPTPYALLTITLPGTTTAGAVLTLMPDASWQPGETVVGSTVSGGMTTNIMGARDEIANGANGVRFELSRGSDASYVDATAFTSVTLTIVALPQKSGDELTVRVAITFSDGKRLDQTFTAPMAPSMQGCAAG